MLDRRLAGRRSTYPTSAAAAPARPKSAIRPTNGHGQCKISRLDREVELSRYYFHLRLVDDQVIADQDGSDLRDAATARQEALAAARQILVDGIKSGCEYIPEAFVIADSEGCELETVPLAAALPKWLMLKLS